jgi:hypothetical protein
VKITLISLLIVLCGFSASAQTLRRQLQDFHRDPRRFMAKLPAKNGNRPEMSFSNQEIENGEFILHKDRFRKNLCKKIGNRRVCPPLKQREHAPFAAIETSPPSIEAFVEGGPIVRNLKLMERLKEAKIRQEPWSDTYWPLYKGALGDRFADPNFPGLGDWKQNYRYAINLDIFSESPKDRLSPSEKYDVIVGDRQKSLTRSNWEQGRHYSETYGSVETWMGLCHGWAPASYMLPRPKHSVRVKTDDSNEEVTFLPSDMKGLATLLWANTQTDTLYLGGRCNDKNPQVDENGRIIDSDCFDTNPGLFHILLVNRLKQSRPFIFDASYDYEVWNQPVIGYSYKYFNPETLNEVESVERAVVPLDRYSRDKFGKYRSPNTKYVAGIQLELAYLAETQASTSETNSSQEDNTVFVEYMYDLELDEDYNIIGGEWYNRAHPDFVWTPEMNTRALSVGDPQIRERWQANEPVPRSWRSAAVRASRESQPLANVVESLLKWAQ